MAKIGIYDRYLSTIGGGERYSCKAAEILSRQEGYTVELLTDLYADLDQVSRQLNLDLSRVNLKVFAFISPDYARRITKGYDLFINATYLSSLPAYGKRNLYLCYFPTPFDVDFGPLHRTLLLSRPLAAWLFGLAERWCKNFEDIEIIQGLYEPKRFLLGRGSWSSGEAVLKFLGPGKVRLGFKNPSKGPLEKMEVKVSAWEGSRPVFEQSMKISSGQRKAADIPSSGNLKVAVESETFTAPGRDTRRLGAVMYEMGRKNVFKKLLLKLLGYIPLFVLTYPRDLGFLKTYQGIIAISRYSQEWIKKLWGAESILLFPPVETGEFKPAQKKKIILTVGRFFPEHHNKKQLEMVSAFKQLCEEYPRLMEGYSLYMAGGLSDKKEHADYVRAVEKQARGYPVKLLPNIGYEKLKELFSVSEIFWHASGMGEDEKKHPEKFEHFGITTVEAMASGCIPIVIDKGGQKEIIRDGIDGFLFSGPRQLKSTTVKVIRGQYDRQALRKNALERAKMFSSQNFSKKLLEIVRKELENGLKHNHS
ncbi:MAG: glycosyltransferase [Actinomycetota bacterium]